MLAFNIKNNTFWDETESHKAYEGNILSLTLRL